MLSEELNMNPEVKSPAAPDSKSRSQGSKGLVWSPVKSLSAEWHSLDVSSHGFIPFLLWLFLFFGGIWFPATGFLRAIFEGQPLPVTYWTPDNTPKTETATPAKPAVTPANSTIVTSAAPDAAGSKEEAGAQPQSPLASGSEDSKAVTLNAWLLLPCLIACCLFWSWTNLALLCVMASSMGEVNRTRLRRSLQEKIDGIDPRPDFRLACTRAFVVYLITIVNGITFGGSLMPSMESGQNDYTRIAVLACIASFLASYRPEFFEALLHKFSSTTTGKEQGVVKSPDSVPPADASDDEAAKVLHKQFEAAARTNNERLPTETVGSSLLADKQSASPQETTIAVK
jgi:hypothetical protein